MKAHLLMLSLVALLAGCAKAVDVEVPYPRPAGDAATGTLVVRFTEPMTSVSIVVDGALVVEDRHTERVVVRDVPVGQRKVTVAASESRRTRSVRHVEVVPVARGETTALLVDTPPHSSGYWIQSAIWGLTPWILLLVDDDL